MGASKNLLSEDACGFSRCENVGNKKSEIALKLFSKRCEAILSHEAFRGNWQYTSETYWRFAMAR